MVLIILSYDRSEDSDVISNQSEDSDVIGHGSDPGEHARITGLNGTLARCDVTTTRTRRA